MPADNASLRDGIFQELGSWMAVRHAVARSVQQVTDFLAPDGVEVFVFQALKDYETLCGEDEAWRCDLLVQVDAGDRDDIMKPPQKVRMLRPGGVFCELWAMKVRVAEKEGLDPD